MTRAENKKPFVCIVATTLCSTLFITDTVFEPWLVTYMLAPPRPHTLIKRKLS
jgi:hypothetical protein